MIKRLALLALLFLSVPAYALVNAPSTNCPIAGPQNYGCVKFDNSTIVLDSHGALKATLSGTTSGGTSLAITNTNANAAFRPLFATNTSAAASAVFVDTVSPLSYNPSTGMFSALGLTTTSFANNGTTSLAGTTSFLSGISATGLSSGTVVSGKYWGLNSSNQVVLGSAASFTPVLQPLSVTTTDTAGNVFPYTYMDSTTTGLAALGAPSWGTAASLTTTSSLRFRFMMPPTLPATGTLNLCTVCQANATSGAVKYTVSDADIATNNTASVGATVLSTETQTSITWSAADNYVTTCTPLTASPAANHISAGAITFNPSGWTLAQILSCNLVERWQ